MLNFLWILLSLQLCKGIWCEYLPKEVKKCHFGDTKCIVESMNDVIRRFPKGIPGIGLKPIDVVDVTDSIFWSNEEAGITWFKFNLFDQVNYGFENTTITEVKGFGKDPTATSMEIHGNIPSLIYKGYYNASGRMLWFLHMNASGESISDFQNFTFVLKLKSVLEFRNNSRYLKIYEIVPTMHLDRWIMWLDDFFHENTDLTIALNQLFNDNWVEFWNELEPSIIRIFTTVFSGFITNIFSETPYDDLFLPDPA